MTFLLSIDSFRRKEKVSKLFFYTYCLALGFFVGVSDMLGGYDRYIYGHVFQENADALYYGAPIINSTFLAYFGTEIGYGLFNSAIGFFTPNRYVFIFIYTMVMYFLLAVSMYKYAKKPFFCLLIFLGLAFFFSFTYLRQIMACGIAWYSIQYFIDKKYYKFFALIALATLFHNSAIYLVLLYFLPNKKPKKKWIVIVMAVLMLIGITGITQYIFSFSSSLTNIEKVGTYSKTALDGFRFEYILEAIVFLVFLLYNYKKVRTDRENIVYLNLYLMFCGVLCFFCLSSDGGRIAWYCYLGIMTVLTDICMYGKKTRLVYTLCLLMVVLYMRILIQWDSLLVPYKSFFTDGYRPNDEIFTSFEYDLRYTYDKFYNLTYDNK